MKPITQGILKEAMPWEIDMAKGWIFVASDNGLIQYDGLSPEVFQFNNRRPARSVNIDIEEEKIFAGGISEFGYFVPSTTKSLEYICLSDSVGEDRHLGNIWGIYHKDGVVYAQGDHAVLLYDLKNGKHFIINSDHKLDLSSMIN